MPAFGRVNGAWEEGDLRARDDAAWTDERDNVFGRLDGAWVQVQPEPLEFLPPINLAADPTSNEVTLTWDDPTQDIVPTHVQLRIPEITPVWTEYIYGTQLAVFSALAAATPFQGQVRYVVRSETDGQVENTSATATVFFTTDAPSGPGAPAADPGGSGPDSIIPWPSTPGGTPGPVGGTDCWWEYIVQEPDAAESALVWRDTAVTGSLDGDIGNQAIDFIALGFACGAFLRLKFREVCNSIPGDWGYAVPFAAPCDWGEACAGVPAGDWTASAWADAIMGMPTVCIRPGDGEGSGLVVEDYVTDDLYGRLPGFIGFDFSEGDSTVIGAIDNSPYGSPTIAGGNSGLATIVQGDDMSLMMFVKLNVQPISELTGGTLLGRFGNRISIRAASTGAGFKFLVSAPKVGGGTHYLVSTSECPLDQWAMVAVTFDQDGDKLLYVNGEVEDTITDTSAVDATGFDDNVEIYTNASGRVRNVGGWDRVLTPQEVLAVAATIEMVQWGTGENVAGLEVGDVIIMYTQSFSYAPTSVSKLNNPAGSDTAEFVSPGVVEILANTMWHTSGSFIIVSRIDAAVVDTAGSYTLQNGSPGMTYSWCVYRNLDISSFPSSAIVETTVASANQPTSDSPSVVTPGANLTARKMCGFQGSRTGSAAAIAYSAVTAGITVKIAEGLYNPDRGVYEGHAVLEMGNYTTAPQSITKTSPFSLGYLMAVLGLK